MTAPAAVPAVPAVEALVGDDLLDDLVSVLTKYVALPSPESADAIALWITATHAQTVLEHASRLVVKSPLKRCGKTRLLEVVSETVHRPLRTTNISTAALVRSIDEADPCTLVLDEADTIFAKRRGEASEKAEDIRGILNSGHSRGWPYTRWDAAKRQVESCPTFSMAAIACIGDLPDTIEDRGVVVGMRRRATAERVRPFRRKYALPELHDIRDRLAAWVTDNLTKIADTEPAMPVEDRAADVWESLVAVADVAGGTWPVRARAACRALTKQGSDPDTGTVSERLLDDLFVIFKDRDFLTTQEILIALIAIDDAPWSEWGGRQLSAHGLARLLRPYSVRPRTKRIGASTLKGYDRHFFEDAWTRYRRSTETDETDTTSASDPPEDPTFPPQRGVSDNPGRSETRSETPGSTVPVRPIAPPVSDVSDVPIVRVSDESRSASQLRPVPEEEVEWRFR